MRFIVRIQSDYRAKHDQEVTINTLEGLLALRDQYRDEYGHPYPIKLYHDGGKGEIIEIRDRSH
jgi:ferredoxin-thioredoxin reductase catalytic subunit